MAETGTINNEELAIICDLMSGWGVKKWAEHRVPPKSKRSIA